MGLGFLVLPTLVVVCAIGRSVHVLATRTRQVQAAREQFFEQNVRPLLAEKCYSCHGDKKQKGGLRLDSLEAILKGGESGPAVVPGKPDESLLVEAINYAGPEMPPNGKLAPGEGRHPHALGLLGCPWPAAIAQPMPRSSRPTAARARLTAADRALWSLQPVRETQASGAVRPRGCVPGRSGREIRSIALSSKRCGTTV